MGKYAVLFLVIAVLVMGNAPRKAAAEEGLVDRKLRQAFPGSTLSAATIKLEVRSKGLLIAASAVAIEPDGRVRFTDCAIARFPRGEAGKGVKPTTIRSEYASFMPDRAVRSITELGSRKILAVELAGGVSVTLDGQ
jgi:hypothetical protein